MGMTLGMVEVGKRVRLFCLAQSVLGREDSNPHQQNQNLRSCP